MCALFIMPTGRARNISSIVNRTNNCGGNKKAGLAPTIGGNTFVMNARLIKGVSVKDSFSVDKASECPYGYSNNPGGQCAGGVGAMAERGCNPGCPPSELQVALAALREFAKEYSASTGIQYFAALVGCTETFTDDVPSILRSKMETSFQYMSASCRPNGNGGAAWEAASGEVRAAADMITAVAPRLNIIPPPAAPQVVKHIAALVPVADVDALRENGFGRVIKIGDGVGVVAFGLFGGLIGGIAGAFDGKDVSNALA